MSNKNENDNVHDGQGPQYWKEVNKLNKQRAERLEALKNYEKDSSNEKPSREQFDLSNGDIFTDEEISAKAFEKDKAQIKHQAELKELGVIEDKPMSFTDHIKAKIGADKFTEHSNSVQAQTAFNKSNDLGKGGDFEK